MRIRYVTGYSETEATAVVTSESAVLWIGANYYLQASQQICEPWTLMKIGGSGVPELEEWLCSNVDSDAIIGFDPNSLSEERYLLICKALQFSRPSMKPVDRNLVDEVWQCDRTPLLRTLLAVHPPKYSGRTWQDKVAETRAEMDMMGVSVLVLTALDEIAWLLNVRGSDIEFERVFYSYVIITMDDIGLFIDDSLMTDEVKKHLRCGSTGGIQVHSYNEFPGHIKLLKCDGKIWLNSKSSQALCSLVPCDKRVDRLSPIRLMKAVKNAAEIDGMRNANIRDSAIQCEFLAWLEAEVPKGQVTEVSAAEKLEALRCEDKLYVAPSFATISCSGPSGAMPLYTPSPHTDRHLTTHEPYMCDSGGHYADGTSDVTRTVHFGAPSQEEKEHFTLVLKSHIALSRAVFPEGILVSRLDSIARGPQWAAGLDYETGTGHGVGASISVVEDPPIVAEQTKYGPLRENMVVTDEPGCYVEGRFGVRIENVCVVVPADTKYSFGDKQFLTLQPITLVPVQLKMVDFSMLSLEEIVWLNDYHSECRSILGEYLNATDKEDVHQWLLSHTEPVTT